MLQGLKAVPKVESGNISELTAASPGSTDLGGGCGTTGALRHAPFLPAWTHGALAVHSPSPSRAHDFPKQTDAY